MPENPLPASPAPPPAEAAAPGKQNNLFAGIILIAVIVLAFVVIYIQLNPPVDKPGETTVQPAGSIPADIPDAPQIPTPPPAETPEATDVRPRAVAIANRLGSDAATLVGMFAELDEELQLAKEELKGTRALYTNALRKSRTLEKDADAAKLMSSEVQLLRAQLSEANALLALAERRSEALMAKLAGSPDPSTLREAEAMRDAFEAELRNTKMRLAQDESEKARLQADLNAATTELAATETVLESTALFIESIDLLPNAAKQLFLDLSRLETVDRAELEKNYRLITQKLGARVVDTVPFITGSSKVDPIKALSVRDAMEAGKSDSFFLVIGYASKTGNFDINKKLSSERATAVATLADEIAQPGQKVRAVFLGQTDRFSTTNVKDDQICELWEIPK